MKTIPTISTMFTAGQLAAPAGVAEFFMSASITDVGLVSGAAELLADAIDLKAPPILADSFHSAHLKFQEIRGKGLDYDAIRIAGNELAGIISGIKDPTWQMVSGELQNMIGHAGIHAPAPEAILRAKSIFGAERTAWRPELIVDIKKQVKHNKVIADPEGPVKRAMGRAMVRRALQLILPLSVYGGRDGEQFYNAAFHSIMLTSPVMKFTFIPIHHKHAPDKGPSTPKEEQLVLSTKYMGIENDVIHFEIEYDYERKIEDILFAHALLSAAYSGRRYNLRERHLKTWPTQSRLYIDHWIHVLYDTMKKLADRPFRLNAAAHVQAALINGEGKNELDKAMERMSVDPETRRHLIKGLDRIDIRFMICERSQVKISPPSVNMDLVPPSEKAKGRNFRRVPTLDMIFTLTPDRMDSLTREEVWMLIAKAYAAWVTNGETKKMERITLPQEFDHSPDTAAFDSDIPYLRLSPNIDNEWARAFAPFVSWFGQLTLPDDVRGKIFPGLAELSPQLPPSTMADMREMTGPLHVNLIDQKDLSHGNGELQIKLRHEGRGIKTDAHVGISLGDLHKFLSPVRLMELILRARAIATGITDVETVKIKRKGMQFREIENAKAHVREWNDAWTWIRLMWGYEKLFNSDAAAVEKLNISGGGANEMASDLLRAIRTLQIKNGELAVGSLRRHNRWIIETSDLLGKPDTKKHKDGIRTIVIPKRVSASKITVLTAKHAKLIHFDGAPRFDEQNWEKIVEAVMAAPDGLTWIKLNGERWESSRPELVLGERDEAWYALNRVYRTSPRGTQTTYRKALLDVRALVKRYAKEISLPRPTPKTSGKDMKTLHRKMALLFHEDRSKNPEHIRTDDNVMQTGKDGIRLVNDLFEILLKFHK